ncbi:MAG: NAD(P)-binding domain-containing protein [Nitrospirota bacterium]|nr:MAG: NAD(P)-binding domain-containing protein [Nitrospirota bacterium]
MDDMIGILGTGRMGLRLAKAYGEKGVNVMLASRNKEKGQALVKALDLPTVSVGTYEEAVQQPFVLPAIFHRDGLLDLLEPFRSELEGKIFIDITNPFNDDYTDFIYPWNTSAAEQLHARFPRVRLIGAFKNVWWEVFDAPYFEGQPSDVYVVGDDEEAKSRFLALSTSLPFRFIDAGCLRNARTVERMTLLCGELGLRYQYFPRMSYRLLGEAWTPGQADTLPTLSQAIYA